jgi:ketosteroid isomerase-like protein
MKRISQELDAQSAAHLEEILAWGVESGEFVCPDTRAAALRLTAVIDGLAVQFAAHDGMLTREDLLDHVRTLAAWEVGLEPDSLRESAIPRREAAFIAPATDIALRQLIARYCDAVVRRDTAAFDALWSNDATWQVGKATIARSDIAASFDKVLKGYKWLVQTAPNAVFEVDEAAGLATGRVTITEQFAKRNGEGSLIGVYHDRYVRKHGTWQFAERRLEVIASAG